jgi:arylsulfatase A-like enzyme
MATQPVPQHDGYLSLPEQSRLEPRDGNGRRSHPAHQQLKEIAPGKPWFIYYVPGATHAPHHPTPEWVQKISDMHLFDEGWNKVREKIFANQKRLGIMPENAKLTPWPKDLPEWDSLSFEEKKLFIKQADVYGAYLAYADNERAVRRLRPVSEQG